MFENKNYFEALRKKAEQVLKERGTEESGDMQDMMRLLHELDASGKGAEIYGFARDVTEFKQAEKEVRDSAQRFAKAFDIETVGVLFFDMTGTFLDANETFLRMIGYDRQSLERGELDSARVTLPEWMPRTWQAFRELIETGRLSPYEKELIRPDGTRWWGFFAGTRLGENEAMEFVIDITERKRVEKALTESEERLRLATEAAGMFNWEVDIESGVFVPSDNAKQVVKYPIPKYMEEVWGLVHPEDIGNVKKAMFRVAREAGEFRVEYRTDKNYTGSEIWLFSAGAAITGEKGGPERVVGVTQNITKHKETEKMLRSWNESLEQRVAERTELAETRARQLQKLSVELIGAEEKERRRIAGFLHDDLQQVLAGARLQLQSVSSDMTANVAQQLKEAIDKCRRLSHELSPAVLHHSGLIPGLERLARDMEDKFGLSVQLKVNTAYPHKHFAIAVFLYRAVQELLFNVVKHAGTQSAQVVLEDSTDKLFITISDRGKGFDPQTLESADANTGCGLISIKERARSIGADLMVESSPGQGSRFTLTVPVHLSNADETGTPKPAPGDIPSHESCRREAESTKSIRVMFVDDHQVMRQGLIAMMQNQPNIQIVGEAADGRQAIRDIRALHPDVVVMDVSMPEMDGIEATRKVKAEFPGIRVVALSMYDDELIIRTMQKAGVDAFTNKSVSAAELLKAINGEGTKQRQNASAGSTDVYAQDDTT